jgi:alpha-N-arabinofuranosidase
MSEWVEYMTFHGVSPMADLREKNGHHEPWKVDYFGVGNENWGCGGNMTPEYYANEYRRYQTYVRNYDEKKKINKICCGANVDDYHWTEGVLKTCFDHTPENLHGFMDLLSLHYYVIPETWEDKGSSTDFDEEGWYKTMNKALYMDTLIKGHGAIMDQYDPEKKIGMSVDEWGAWYNTEPGTNPGFLYQQNTVRDALIAGITLNIFNKHCDRVKMANLAQMVNVLQAVLLTEGEQMVKTPTYHVMHMYRHHQGASLLESSLTNVDAIGPDEWVVPKVTESVSENAQGVITITLNNLSIEDTEKVDVQFARGGYQVVEAHIVTDPDMHAHNTFEAPENVTEKEFYGFEMTEKGMVITLPPNSVVEIRVAR